MMKRREFLSGLLGTSAVVSLGLPALAAAPEIRRGYKVVGSVDGEVAGMIACNTLLDNIAPWMFVTTTDGLYAYDGTTFDKIVFHNGQRFITATEAYKPV